MGGAPQQPPQQQPQQPQIPPPPPAQGPSPAQNPGSSPASAIVVPPNGPLGHVRNTSSLGSATDAAAQLAALPESMKAQVTKMYEQQRRAAPGPTPFGGGGVAAAGSGSGSGVGGGAVQGGSTGVGGGPGGGKQVAVWQGALRWNGIGQMGKKEVGCNVVVMSMTPHEWCVFRKLLLYMRVR